MRASANKKLKESKSNTKKPAFKHLKKLIPKIDQIVKKQIKSHQDAASTEETPQSASQVAVQSTSSSSQREPEISFFYTNDKFMNSFEDVEIVTYIQSKYENFLVENSPDSQLKKIIVLMLQDKKFMTEMLNYYSMSIQDFFKFLFRLDASIFKGQYLNKLNKIIVENHYT